MWWWPVYVLGISLIVVFFRIVGQNYTMVAILIIVQDFKMAKSRRAGLVRLLIANIGGYVLAIGLIALEMGGLDYPLYFEIETPWTLNLLYTIGAAVVLAPPTLFFLSVRIKWLDRLLHGY